MPTSFTMPLSSTTIMSASCTEAIRWAMMSLVVPGISSRKAWRIMASVRVSTAEVESSRMRILGFFSSARAIQSRCF